VDSATLAGSVQRGRFESKVESQFFCPNCGESLDSRSLRSQFNCRHCGEALLLSSDNKITLAKPIQTYLALDDQVQGTDYPPDKGAASIPQRSTQRKRKTAEIALERIANEKRDFTRGIFYGLLFIIFGMIFILISFLREAFVSSDWLNWIGFAVGLVFLPLGAYFALWFYNSSQSLSRDEEEIGEEIIRSV
jgi:predicted RNA-binding Zn-ribbon protein involved in translation (DUF1610 family)